VASLSQGRTAAAQCGLFTYKSVPAIFEPPCNIKNILLHVHIVLIPVDLLSKALVCSCSISGMAGSNPAEGIYIRL